MFAYSDHNIFYAVVLCQEASGILPNIQLQVTKTINTRIHVCTSVCVLIIDLKSAAFHLQKLKKNYAPLRFLPQIGSGD